MTQREWFAAVLGGRWEDVRALHAQGADLDCTDRDGRSALFHAILNGDLAGARWLVEAGCRLDLADRLGKTPLHYAVQMHDAGLVELLCARRTPIEAADAHGNTPLSDAVFESRGRGEVIAVLLRHGADPDRSNHHGVTPRSLAASIGNFDVAQFLPN